MTLSGCIHCHFRFVEDEVLSFFPPCRQARVRREYNSLRARGMPRVAVDDIAATVLAACWFYCPPAVIARVEADYAKLGIGHA